MKRRFGRGAIALAMMVAPVASSAVVAATAHAEDLRYSYAGTYPSKGHCTAAGNVKSNPGYFYCTKTSMITWKLYIAF